MSEKNSIEQAADRIWQALESATPCEPIRDLIGDKDIEAAYEVQNIISNRRLDDGSRIVGSKVGLTSDLVQKQLGVDQPDYGLLFDYMDVADGDEISFSKLMQPKVEAEIAFILKADIEGPTITKREVLDAIEHVVPAIEIVGSRIRNWDITITDTIADNASASHYVLGSEWIDADDLDEADVETCKMVMYKNGTKVSEGIGANCMGSPINSIIWLAKKMIELGEPLREGDVVLSGALGPMCDIKMGDKIEARIEGLGSVSVSVGK